jgi:hypothetical protein
MIKNAYSVEIKVIVLRFFILNDSEPMRHSFPEGAD